MVFHSTEALLPRLYAIISGYKVKLFAFSTCWLVEYVLILHDTFSASLVMLSQCDPEEEGSCDSGCNGGLMNSAFEYTLKAGGLMREEDYPYTGTDRGTCKFDKTKIAATVANFSVVSLDEDQIAANLVKNGPLAG